MQNSSMSTAIFRTIIFIKLITPTYAVVFMVVSAVCKTGEVATCRYVSAWSCVVDSDM